jgi:hypothetical protein
LASLPIADALVEFGFFAQLAVTENFGDGFFDSSKRLL